MPQRIQFPIGPSNRAVSASALQLSLSWVGQHVAIGIAAKRRETTRLKERALEPRGEPLLECSSVLLLYSRLLGKGALKKLARHTNQPATEEEARLSATPPHAVTTEDTHTIVSAATPPKPSFPPPAGPCTCHVVVPARATLQPSQPG